MEVTLFVNRMFIPLTKMIIRSLIGWVIEIERSRIDCKFVKTLRIKMSRTQNRFVGLRKKLKCSFNNVTVATGRQSRTADVNWNRPNPFLSVGFHSPSLQRRDRAMTKVVVKLLKSCVGDCLSGSRISIAYIEFAKYRFHRPCDEKRIEYEVGRVSKYQVRVLLLISRQ